MENKQVSGQVEVRRTSGKRKYLIGVGIIKAIICAATYFVMYLKIYRPDSLIIAIAVATLIIVDIFTVAIAQKRGIRLRIEDAGWENLVAAVLLAIGLCYIAVIDATTCKGGGLIPRSCGVDTVLFGVIVALMIVGAIFQVLFILTAIVFLLCPKRS